MICEGRGLGIQIATFGLLPVPTRVRSLFIVLSLISALACDRSPEPIRAALGPAPTDEARGPSAEGRYSSGTALRLLTSSDQGASWALSPDVIAHGVSSLHACTYEGEVWVPCLLDVREISWRESAFPVPFVDVLRSKDLVHWTADRIRVRGDTTGGVDPACVVGPNGLEMWFAEVAGTDGDPAQGAKPTQIWRTTWQEDHFGAAEVAYRGRGVVDPAPTYFDGALRLFLNQDGTQVVELMEGRLVSAWPNATVPQVAELDDRRVLVAQQPRGQGMLPAWRALLDGEAGPGLLGAASSIAIDHLLRSCESPSMTTFEGKWLLFCIDASGRSQFQAPQPSPGQGPRAPSRSDGPPGEAKPPPPSAGGSSH